MVSFEDEVKNRLKTLRLENLLSSGLSYKQLYLDDYQDGDMGWKVPIKDPLTGKVKYLRTRLDKPKDDQPKYLQPEGKGLFPFFPAGPDWKSIFEDTSSDLIVTEGEKKASKLAQEGFPAISMPGVYAFASPSVYKYLEEQIKWEGRILYVCYDSDSAYNPNVAKAIKDLALYLNSLGAKVKNIDLNSIVVSCRSEHPTAYNCKVGVDDFAKEHGSNFPEVFQDLMGKADDPLRDILKTDAEINKLLDSYNVQAPSLDIEQLSPVCREFLEWSGRSTYASDEALLLSFLTVLGAALRKSVTIKSATSAIYPNLWTIVLGRSGSAKSTAVSISLDILYSKDLPLIEDFVQKLKQYQRDLEDYKKETKKKHKKSKYSDDKEYEIPEPVYPKDESLGLPIVTSLERIIECLGNEKDSGLISTSEEMAMWLVNLNKTDNLKELLTSAYGGKVPPNLLSHKTNRTIILNNPLISILGPSTEEWIFQNLQATDFYSGFYQRVLWVINHTDKSPEARPPERSPEGYERFSNVIETFYSQGLSSHKAKQYYLSCSAWSFFEDKFNELQIFKANLRNDTLISCYDRLYNDYWFKFSLVLHLLEGGWSKPEIQAETFKQAFHLVGYFRETVEALSNFSANKEHKRMVDRIISELRKQKGFVVKENELRDKLQGYTTKKELFNSALEEIEASKIIEIKHRRNGSNSESKTKLIYLLQKPN